VRWISRVRARRFSSTSVVPPRRHIHLESCHHCRPTSGRARVGEAPKWSRRASHLCLVALVQILIVESSLSAGLPRRAMADSSRLDRKAKTVGPGQGYSRLGGPCAGRPAGRFQPTARLSFFPFPFFNIHRNSYKFPNFIENYSNLIKKQSKFRMDHPEKIYALGLTKSLFMHYCLVDKSKKSNFEEFIYKNLCMFIH
jgi:hypothetical protein